MIHFRVPTIVTLGNMAPWEKCKTFGLMPITFKNWDAHDQDELGRNYPSTEPVSPTGCKTSNDGHFMWVSARQSAVLESSLRTDVKAPDQFGRNFIP